uniref:Uncharacterized protein n=1 Tax=Aegilops tauschii subsp. strangulata TaxID=200361 RepID=A0A452YL32_AEGTS
HARPAFLWIPLSRASQDGEDGERPRRRPAGQASPGGAMDGGEGGGEEEETRGVAARVFPPGRPRGRHEGRGASSTCGHVKCAQRIGKLVAYERNTIPHPVLAVLNSNRISIMHSNSTDANWCCKINMQLSAHEYDCAM